MEGPPSTGEEKKVVEISLVWNTQELMKRGDIFKISDTAGYRLLRDNYTRFLNELERVPIPSRDYPLDRDRVKEYINEGKHSAIKDKRIRQLVVDHTYYISFDDLIKNMCKALDEMMKGLEGRPWVVIMYNTEHQSYDYTKSYGWIFRLCLDKCRNIHLNPPVGLLLSPTDLEDILPLIMSGYLRDFVILDDISYSGFQIRSLGNFTRERLLELHVPEKVFEKINVVAVIAVIAGTAVLFQENDKYSICRIPIYYGKKIDGFRHLLTEDDIKYIDELNICSGIIGAPNIYASHKLPDEYSIMVTEIAPLISGCEDFYGDDQTFDTLTPPCPSIPYKTVRYNIDKDYKHYSDYLIQAHQTQQTQQIE
jgi:hypothetical protein